MPESHSAIDGVRFTVSEAAQSELSGSPATSFLDVAHAHDYVAILAFLPPDDARFAGPLNALRATVSATTGGATMFGYGPRYLHSTGQLHKGGANNGVFIVISAEPDDDLDVPGEPFSFGVLETAQALGDFQSLDRTGRRAIFVQASTRNPEVLERALASFTRA
jgi:hypothetical protein